MQLHEDAIIEGLEKMCDPDKEAGEWLTKIDIVEDGEQLKLVEMDEVGHRWWVQCGAVSVG